MSESKYLTVPHLNRKELARIFSKISVNRETGCWEWTASRRNKSGGYGQVWYCGQMRLAHRVLYAWAVEPLPKGGPGVPELDHFICSNPPCCNPAHLRLVPHKANAVRGKSFVGVNARKTHCNKGHKLPDSPNVPEGRRCRICSVETADRNYKRRMAGGEREHILELKRKHQRRYAQKNPEKVKAQMKAWREANKEKIKAARREYFLKHGR